MAKEVGSRSGDQCWKRWNDSLDPNLDHSQWTPSEDQILEEAVLHAGRLWSKIAGENLPGRSGLACKNRWDHIQRKQRRLHQSQRDVLQGHGGVNANSRSFIDSTYFSETHRNSLASSSSASAGPAGAANAAAVSSSASGAAPNHDTASKSRVQMSSDTIQRHPSMLSLEPHQAKYEHEDDTRSLLLSNTAHKNNLFRPNQVRGYAAVLGSNWTGSADQTSNPNHGHGIGNGNPSTISPYVGYQTSFSSPMTDSRTLPTTNSYSSPYPPTNLASYPFHGHMSMNNSSSVVNQQRNGSGNFSTYPPSHASQYSRNGSSQPSQLLSTLESGSCTGGMLAYTDDDFHNTTDTITYQHGNALASSGPSTNTNANPSNAIGFLHSFAPPHSQSVFPNTCWPSRTAQPSSTSPRGNFPPYHGHSYFTPRSHGVPLPFHTKPAIEQQALEEKGEVVVVRPQQSQQTRSTRDHPMPARCEQVSPSALYVPNTGCSLPSTTLSGQAWSPSASFPRETMAASTYSMTKSTTSHPFAFSPGPIEGRTYPAGDIKRERFVETRETGAAEVGRQGDGEMVKAPAGPAGPAAPAASPAPSHDEPVSTTRDSEPLASPCPLPRGPKVEDMANSLFCDDFQYRGRLEHHRRVDHAEYQDDEVTSDEEESQLVHPPKQLPPHPTHILPSSSSSSHNHHPNVNLLEPRLSDNAQRPTHYL